MLVGLRLVTGFVLLRMAVPIIRDFSNPDALRAFHPGPFTRWLIAVADPALVRAPASQFVAPILLIWILVAFRKEDWGIVHSARQGDATEAV